MRTAGPLVLCLTLLPAGAAAQLLPQVLPRAGGVLGAGEVLGNVADGLRAVGDAARSAAARASDRLARIDALVRANRSSIAVDERGDAARAGEVIVADPDGAVVAAAQAKGFTLLERGDFDGLGIGFARFATPHGTSLARAVRMMRKLAGGRDVSADQLHFQGGTASAATSGAAIAPAAAIGARIGMIDGGVGATAALDGSVTARGFARGAPRPSNHGSAIASLLLGAGKVRGAADGAMLFNADVYGQDVAGGGALAIARALAWLSQNKIPVTVISLVGPPNPVLARVVAAVEARGMIIVAAVGNDGPAAPPSYPASYPGVVAVTGVDARNRALIEAGRALHLDYAAPGADMLAADMNGRAVKVRGTSFAAPLAAARIARFHRIADPLATAATIQAVDREARDLGAPGPDRRFGRGLLCETCRTPAK